MICRSRRSFGARNLSMDTQHTISMDSIVLKPGKEKSLLNKQSWVFTGAIQTTPKGLKAGELVTVPAHREFLGQGYQPSIPNCCNLQLNKQNCRSLSASLENITIN